eukprot:403365921
MTSKHFNYNIEGEDVVNLLGMSVLSSIAQIFFINALFFDKAGRCASLFMLNIVYGYMSDVLVFNYQMQWYEISGTCVLIGCSIVVFVIKFYYFRS